MQEEKLSGTDSLELIQSMINKARNQFGENGHLYLLWGWVVLVCSIAQFVLYYYFHSPFYQMVWMLTWLALAYQMIYLYRRRNRRRVKTYTSDILGYVWLVFVVLMFLIGFHIGNMNKEVGYRLLSPLLIGIYGMPTFLSGRILRFRPLVIGGIACWVLSLLMAFVPYAFQLLGYGVAVIIAWIIPGYLLNIRFKREQQ